MTNNTRYRSKSVRSVNVFGCGAWALLALSCGGSGPSSEMQIPAASAGDEPPPSAAVSEAVDPTAEPAKPARGRIAVHATCEGKPVEAHGHMPIERGLVVDFEMGHEFSAEVGTRHLEVTLADDSVLVDKPTLQLDVEVEPRKLSSVYAVFPWAKVQLNVLVHGTAQPPMKVKLIRKGEAVAEVMSGSPFLVSPGNYEADVPLRGKTVRVKGLVFFESTDQVVPVRAVL